MKQKFNINQKISITKSINIQRDRSFDQPCFNIDKGAIGTIENVFDSNDEIYYTIKFPIINCFSITCNVQQKFLRI